MFFIDLLEEDRENVTASMKLIKNNTDFVLYYCFYDDGVCS